MNETLDDENLETKEKISFIKWWERKRIFYNIYVLSLIALGFMDEYVNSNYRLEIKFSAFYFLLVFLLLVNVLYSIFSLISFGFKIIIEKTNRIKLKEFFQRKNVWIFLFIIQLLLTLGILVIIIGSRPAVPPFPHSPSF